MAYVTCCALRGHFADEIGVSSSQLGKLLFIQKEQPDYIDMIDEQRLTIRQAYLTVSRTKKQRESLRKTEKSDV